MQMREHEFLSSRLKRQKRNRKTERYVKTMPLTVILVAIIYLYLLKDLKGS